MSMLKSSAVIFLASIWQVTFCYSQKLTSHTTQGFNRKPALLWTADWSANDKQIAAGGDDSLLLLYHNRSFTLLKVYEINGMIRQLSWHPVKSLLAIAANNKAGILNTETGAFTELAGVKEGARGIGWNFNGQLLATADNEGLVKIWNIKGQLLRTIRKEDSNSYFSLHWHPSKNILAVGGDDIRIMDTSGVTHQVIKHRPENTGILTIRWHPSGEFFSVGDYGHAEEGIESTIQFRKEDGSLIKTLHGSKAEYRNIRWDKEGNYLASASDALRIWDKKGELLFIGPSSNLLWGVSWNAKSDSIITTSINGAIDLWTGKATFIKALD